MKPCVCLFPRASVIPACRQLDTDETLGFKLHLKVAFLLHSIVLQSIAQTDLNVAHSDARSITTQLRC